jgi:hypothetical protein
MQVRKYLERHKKSADFPYELRGIWRDLFINKFRPRQGTDVWNLFDNEHLLIAKFSEHLE